MCYGTTEAFSASLPGGRTYIWQTAGLLGELGIKLESEPPSMNESRIFQRPFSQVTGNRLDASSNWKRISLDSDKFPMRKLVEVIGINPRTVLPKVNPETPVSFVPMDAVSDIFGEIRDRQTRPLSECKSYTKFQEGDLLWAKITPCMENGKSAIASDLSTGFPLLRFDRVSRV